MEDYTYSQCRNRNPREKANILSRLTFFYTLPTFILGYRKEITEDDLYEVLPEHNSSILGTIGSKLWKIERKHARVSKREPSLKRVLVKIFIMQYLKIGLLIALIEFLIKPYQAILIGNLISFYTVNNEEELLKAGNPNISAASIILCNLTVLFILHPCMLESLHIGMKMRIVCSCLIYRKLLKLNKVALGHTTSGQIINLLSNDVHVLDRMVLSSQYLWVGPVQAIIIMRIMYREVGISFVFGVALLLMFLPFYSILGKKISKYRLKISNRRDKRIRLMNEVIHGIRVIKMYTWERPFAKMISAYRNLEILSISSSLYIKGIFAFYTVFITTSLFLTITCTLLLKNKIPPSSIFVLTNLFFTLGISLTFVFPQGIAIVNEANVSISRITNFLLLDEKRRWKKSNGITNVTITDGSARWNKSFALKNINLYIPSGKLTTIIGKVGCGKSTLFQMILGELPLSSGRILTNGRFSYASQDPWIFSGSIRQNILFGSKMNVTRYEQVIKCCGLEMDLKSFQYSDQTTVGERGSLLSGGQKARINLARAVYKPADVYLFDDPFSSVDLCVGKQIFEDCIQTFLKEKTVILITHGIQYIKQTDYLIVLENNSVKVEGYANQLEQIGVDFVSYVESKSPKHDDLENNEARLAPFKDIPKVVEEQQSSGFILWSIYKAYVLACRSFIIIFCVVALFVLTQIVVSGSYYFLAFWAQNDLSDSKFSYIVIYSAITIAHIILTILRCVFFVSFSMRSSKELHRSMFNGVISAGLTFFNLNPSGRILNRFSKDLGTIDELLPNSIFIAIKVMLSILGTLVVICVLNPKFLIPTVIVTIAFYYIRKFYLTSSLTIMRVEGAARSPLYAHVNASLQGLTTIRALGVQRIVSYDFEQHLNLHSSAFYSYLCTARAFSYWTDAVCFTYLTIITLYYILTVNDNCVSNVGLSITQAIQLMGQLQYGVKQTTETENCMTSVERILEYTSLVSESTMQEPHHIKPPKSWPSHGQIIFINVFLKYPPNDHYMLRNLNFIIQPQEKIGIVGRTGAGKSSLVSAMLQLVEIEGSILIDQIDIKHLDLHALRSNITIIPQNPFLFTATVRINLDPFNEFEDEVLWKALDEVKLKNVFADLDGKILDNGSNLSVGQRQLLCLARAIIRKNKIIVLDEATANVDLETETCIQEITQKNFAASTVITIAHRINTIMNSDKVLVMDDGEIVEYDNPLVLLEDPESVFSQMVNVRHKSEFSTVF